MRYKEIYNTYVEINEVFDKSLDYNLSKTNDTQWSGGFHFEDYRFKVLFKFHQGIWVVWFWPTNRISKITDPVPLEWETELLNTKKTSLFLFSTVIKMIKEWIEKEKPKEFKFEVSGINNKRAKLYQKIIDYLNLKKDIKYTYQRKGNTWKFSSILDTSDMTKDEFEDWDRLDEETQTAYHFLCCDNKWS